MTAVSETPAPARAAVGADGTLVKPPKKAPWPIISADDHLIEPPDLFQGRMPSGLVDRAPRIVEDADGTQAWVYEGGRYPNIGLNAREIEQNAGRGFKAVSFVEQPVNVGLPSLHTDHWDPFLAACQETGTVVCLHTASGSWTAATSPGAPLELYTTLFPVNALAAAADWLWARVPVRFPRLRIVLAEGGIGWVPMLLDRLDWVMGHSATGGDGVWAGDLTPAEALRRNFWFCTIDDPSTLAARHRIGVDHILVESDYPHADSSWPHPASLLAERFLA